MFFPPIWKIWTSQIGSWNPNFRGENKKYLKTQFTLTVNFLGRRKPPPTSFGRGSSPPLLPPPVCFARGFFSAPPPVALALLSSHVGKTISETRECLSQYLENRSAWPNYSISPSWISLNFSGMSLPKRYLLGWKLVFSVAIIWPDRWKIPSSLHQMLRVFHHGLNHHMTSRPKQVKVEGQSEAFSHRVWKWWYCHVENNTKKHCHGENLYVVPSDSVYLNMYKNGFLRLWGKYSKEETVRVLVLYEGYPPWELHLLVTSRRILRVTTDQEWRFMTFDQMQHYI